MQAISGFPGVDLGDNGLDHADNELLSAYNPEMNRVISAFKDWHGKLSPDAAYLFLVPKADGGLQGYMPFNRQFGFVVVPLDGAGNVDAATLARTAAHELGHGIFSLRHTFSTKNFVTLPQGTTDNLMDYSGTQATKLYKYQWDLIHDPQTILFAWAEEEEEGEMGGKWTILDKKHTLLFNHVYDNNKEGDLKYHEKIADALLKNSKEESIDLEYTEKEEKEWISQWKLRTASSDQILDKIITKIQKAEKGKQIEKMNLKAKGIYIGKYKLNDIEYPIAIYSEKYKIDNIIKVQVSEVSELEKEENRKHVKAEETFIKYLVIAFYEEGNNEPVLMVQIEKFDISKSQNTKKKWLEFLKILKVNNEIIPGNPLIEMIIVHNNSAPTSGGMFGCSRVGYGCEQTTIPNLPKYDNNKKVHDGLDLFAALNTDVYAMYDGEIVFIENSVPPNEQGTVGNLGNRILIKHTATQHGKNTNTIFIMYGHLNNVEKNIQSGTKVKQGEKIGISGKTGNAYDIEAWRYHVHLMIYENGTSSENKVDPRKYLTTKFDNNGNKIE